MKSFFNLFDIESLFVVEWKYKLHFKVHASPSRNNSKMEAMNKKKKIKQSIIGKAAIIVPYGSHSIRVIHT